MDVSPHRQSWENEQDDILFYNLIGLDFGNEPWNRVPEIIASKEKEALYVLNEMGLQHANGLHGLEIGVGMGHQTKVYAARAAKLYACDISDSYLARARKYCADQKQIEFHYMKFGDLSFIPANTLDFAIIHNVMIHLNFYEILLYLRQVHAAMKSGGKFFFDIMDVEKIDFENDSLFKLMNTQVHVAPENRAAIQYNSWPAIQKYCALLGFKISDTKIAGGGPGRSIVAIKI